MRKVTGLLCPMWAEAMSFTSLGMTSSSRILWARINIPSSEMSSPRPPSAAMRLMSSMAWTICSMPRVRSAEAWPQTLSTIFWAPMS